MIPKEQSKKCERCGAIIPENDEREFHGKVICEDCYMIALSPAKTCDPWAAYCAKSFSEKNVSIPKITERQSSILQILKETDGLNQSELAERLKLSLSDLEREIATLHHMEKLKAEMRGGQKIICLM